MSSHCSSKYCQVGELTLVINAIPSISTQDSLTPSAFKTAIIDWLFGSWTANCHRRLQEPLPADEFIYFDKDSVT